MSEANTAQEDQTTVEAQEAEAGFAAGFTKVSGKEPVEKVALDDEAVAAKAKEDAEAKAATDAEAKAKADAEAKTRAETLSPEEIAALRALPGQVRNIAGHLGGMNSRLKDVVDAASKATARAGVETPSSAQITAAAGGGEKWKKLKEEFPEWADAFDERLAAVQQANTVQAPATQTPVDVVALSTQVTQRVTSELSGSFAALLKDATEDARQLARVDVKHDGWVETINTPDFKTWLKSQAPETQALTKSTKAVDAIKLLDSFEGHRKSVQAAAAEKARNEKRLRGAVTVQGSGREPAAAGIDDDQAFARGFKRVARAK